MGSKKESQLGNTATTFSRTSGWRFVELRLVTGQVQTIIDGTNVNNYSITVDFNDFALAGYGAGTGCFDDGFVRKFVDPEPAHSVWGSEETLNPIFRAEGRDFAESKFEGILLA